MARGFRGLSGGFRGGGGRRGGGNGADSRSSGRSRSSSKGQVKGGKVVQYAIKDSKGKTKYYGTTNNPRQRAVEHRQSGKLGEGDELVVQTKAVSRKSAEKVESARLASHRRQYGRNPKHNISRDGKYHNPR